MKPFTCPFCPLVYDENHPSAEVAVLHSYELHLDIHMARHDVPLPVAS